MQAVALPGAYLFLLVPTKVKTTQIGSNLYTHLNKVFPLVCPNGWSFWMDLVLVYIATFTVGPTLAPNKGKLIRN